MKNKMIAVLLGGFGVLMGTLLVLQVALSKVPNGSAVGALSITVPAAIISIMAGIMGSVKSLRLCYHRSSPEMLPTAGAKERSGVVISIAKWSTLAVVVLAAESAGIYMIVSRNLFFLGCVSMIAGVVTSFFLVRQAKRLRQASVQLASLHKGARIDGAGLSNTQALVCLFPALAFTLAGYTLTLGGLYTFILIESSLGVIVSTGVGILLLVLVPRTTLSAIRRYGLSEGLPHR